MNGHMLVLQILYRRWLKCEYAGSHTMGHCQACGVHL